MKTLLTSLAASILLILALFVGCKKEDPPVPNFSFTGDNQPAPCEVIFINLSTNFNSLKWEFGDGGSSTEANPKHTYASSGTFSVKLTATGNGGEQTAIKEITVKEPIPNPIADFSFSGTDGYAPRTVSFSNKSVNANSYAWDFGDGQTSNEVNPSHVYNNGGTYNVSLTAKNSANATSTISKSIVIATVPNPVADFSISGDNVFAPRVVTFTNRSSGAVSYNWNFGDGSSSSDVNPTHLFRSGGTYNVTLSAYNSANVVAKIAQAVVIKNAPTKMSINSLILTKIPFIKPNGAGWDSNSGPDVYFTIMDDAGNTYFKSGQATDLIQANLPVLYSNMMPFAVPSLDFKYRIDFRDDDVLTSDWIGGYYFTATWYMPTNGELYPTSINVGSDSDAIKFTLNLTWQ